MFGRAWLIFSVSRRNHIPQHPRFCARPMDCEMQSYCCCRFADEMSDCPLDAVGTRAGTATATAASFGTWSERRWPFRVTTPQIRDHALQRGFAASVRSSQISANKTLLDNRLGFRSLGGFRRLGVCIWFHGFCAVSGGVRAFAFRARLMRGPLSTSSNRPYSWVPRSLHQLGPARRHSAHCSPALPR